MFIICIHESTFPADVFIVYILLSHNLSCRYVYYLYLFVVQPALVLYLCAASCACHSNSSEARNQIIMYHCLQQLGVILISTYRVSIGMEMTSAKLLVTTENSLAMFLQEYVNEPSLSLLPVPSTCTFHLYLPPVPSTCTFHLYLPPVCAEKVAVSARESIQLSVGYQSVCLCCRL